MSRISNLTSIRNQLTNTWHSDWFDDKYYEVLLFDDIKTRHYVSSIFKRLEAPTSHFFIKRDNNLNFYFFFDLFFLERENVSHYRRLFKEVEKFDYFLYINYYTVYTYYFFKLKQSGLKSKVNIGFNSDSYFPYKLGKKKLHNRMNDSSKLFIFNIFYQKKDRFSLFKKYNVEVNSYMNLYKENNLEILDKFAYFYSLNLNRDEYYNSVMEWNKGWYNKEVTFFSDILFFFFSLLLKNHKVNSFLLSFFNNIQRKPCDFVNYFFYYYHNSFNNVVVDDKLKMKQKVNNDNSLFTNGPLFFFLKKKHQTLLNKMHYYHMVVNKLILLLMFILKKINHVFNSLKIFQLLTKKWNVFFYNSFFLSEKTYFLNDWFKLKRVFYGHKKFLKRVSSFSQLKYKFIDKTYRKQFIKEYFSFFFKEMEKTISFYLSGKSNNIYTVLLFPNMFFKHKNQFVAIKDAKIVSDYVMLKLNKQFSLNRIFYEIRDWQFKNYYNRRYLVDKKNKFLNLYGDKFYPVLGIRIECSGSYKPGSRKRKKYYGEVVKEVELVNKSPNNSFYADLDYYQSTSRLKSGSIGIKVWVFFKTHIYNKNKHFVSIVTSD